MPLPRLDDLLVGVAQANAKFLATSAHEDEDRVPSTTNTRSLVVLQNEQATFSLSQFDYCGSEDATTCVILVVLGQEFGYVCHLDDSVFGTAEEEESVFHAALKKCTNSFTSRADVFLVGAYDDDESTVLVRTLRALEQSSSLLDIRLACVGARVNRHDDGRPRTRALAVHIPTRTPEARTFAYRGPEIHRRHASRSFLPGLRSILLLDDTSGQLVLDAFTIPKLNSSAARLYEHLVLQADADPLAFLHNTSTSPEHESDRFVDDIRGSCAFILDHRAGAHVDRSVYVMRGGGGGEWLPE